MPEVRAKAKAKDRLRGILGSDGAVGMRAESTMRKLLERSPAETPASFIFSSRPS